MALLLWVLLATLPAQAQPAPGPVTELELVLDPLPEAPYLGEMLLGTLQGRYGGKIALEDLRLPAIEDFTWLQLGTPEWSDIRVGGAAGKGYAQRIAFFPQRAGPVTIPALTHSLTLVDGGARVETAVVSDPVTLTVRPPPEIGEERWLPARAVTVRDEWEPAPDAIAPNGWTHRTITVEVAGLPPEALPPPPPMYAGGLWTYWDPEERSVVLTPEGPVSTVVWRYRMQTQTETPADLDNIPLFWFDTGARVARSILLEGREIAFAASALPYEPGPVARLGVPAGLGLGAALGLAVLLPGLGLRRSRAVGRVRRALALALLAVGLALAERRGDASAARRTLLRLLRLRGADPQASRALARLDRQLFGPEAEAKFPRGLARAALAESPVRPSAAA